MDLLVEIKKEERKLEKQLDSLQQQLDGFRSAAKALGGLGSTVGREATKVVKQAVRAGKRTMSAEARAKIAKAAKARWARYRAENGKEAKGKSKEEEKETGKKVAKKAKLGGLFRESSALGYLYKIFEDEKPHSEDKILAELKKKFGSNRFQGGVRIRRFTEKGEEAGAFAVIRDKEEGTLQLKFGKPGKKAINGSGHKMNGNNTTKDIRTTAAHILRILATEGGEWSKNKMIEYMSDKHGKSPEVVKTAIQNEIEGESLTYKNGLLELA